MHLIKLKVQDSHCFVWFWFSFECWMADSDYYSDDFVFEWREFDILIKYVILCIYFTNQWLSQTKRIEYRLNLWCGNLVHSKRSWIINKCAHLLGGAWNPRIDHSGLRFFSGIKMHMMLGCLDAWVEIKKED